jgi:hypothetical protein
MTAPLDSRRAALGGVQQTHNRLDGAAPRNGDLREGRALHLVSRPNQTEARGPGSAQSSTFR